MKHYLNIALICIAMAVIVCSCNTRPKSAAKPVSALITHKDAFDAIPLQAYDSLLIDSLNALPVAYTVLDTAEAKELLNKADLDGLISSFRSGDLVYNGFLGDNNYRIEFYIKKVEADTANPFVLKVTGKTRFKKNITPFAGTIHIDKVYGFRDMSYDYKEFLQHREKDEVFTGDTLMFSYHTRGSFAFAEEKDAKGAGVFNGNFFMDFRKREKYSDEEEGEEHYNIKYQSENDTRKAGILMEGQWENYAHTAAKHVIASKDLFMFANDILEDFSYGEREVEINQKYHALGWDNYWDGEEWWNDGKESTVLLSIY